MDTQFLHSFLLRSMIINYAILLVWFFFFVFARGWIRRIHGKWFRLEDATFDALHYGGMSVYKIGILLFNVAPLIAICMMSHNG